MDPAIRSRITALLRLAQGRGTTEAEAMAAAAKAAELMAEYGLKDDDIEFDEADAALKTKGRGARDALWATVARCTNCAGLLQPDWTPVITFVGRAPGPELAVYLVAVLNRAVDREIEAFKASSMYRRRRTITTRRQAVQDFTLGLVTRLRQRLLDLFAASMSEDAREKAVAVRDARFGASQPVKSVARSVRYGNAAGAGFAAGEQVNLAHGVNGTKPVRQIGGRS